MGYLPPTQQIDVSLSSVDGWVKKKSFFSFFFWEIIWVCSHGIVISQEPSRVGFETVWFFLLCKGRLRPTILKSAETVHLTSLCYFGDYKMCCVSWFQDGHSKSPNISGFSTKMKTTKMKIATQTRISSKVLAFKRRMSRMKKVYWCCF